MESEVRQTAIQLITYLNNYNESKSLRALKQLIQLKPTVEFKTNDKSYNQLSNVQSVFQGVNQQQVNLSKQEVKGDQILFNQWDSIPEYNQQQPMQLLDQAGQQQKKYIDQKYPPLFPQANSNFQQNLGRKELPNLMNQNQIPLIQNQGNQYQVFQPNVAISLNQNQLFQSNNQKEQQNKEFLSFPQPLQVINVQIPQSTFQYKPNQSNYKQNEMNQWQSQNKW